MSKDVPNLDALSIDECFSFWARHQDGRACRALFPFPRDTRQARLTTSMLANYAANIGAAKRTREAGKIEDAQRYERIAERIYERLPTWARW